MAFEFFNLITFIRFYILLTIILILRFYDRKNDNHRIILLIVFFGLCNEFLSAYLSLNKYPITINNNLYVLVNSSLWMFLLFKNFRNIFYIILIILYFIFGLLNIIYSSTILKFNNTNFIIGSIIYLICYIVESYNNLKKENLNFFLSNNYILLSAPILFFIGFSLMLSFSSKELTSYLIFEDIKLYNLIGNFVNIFYYTIINIYILKERTSKNG